MIEKVKQFFLGRKIAKELNKVAPGNFSVMITPYVSTPKKELLDKISHLIHELYFKKITADERIQLEKDMEFVKAAKENLADFVKGETEEEALTLECWLDEILFFYQEALKQ